MSTSRASLLEAAIHLAKSGRLEQVDAAAICAQAGLSAETYAAEFADESAFCEALHRRHLETLLGAIAATTQDSPPGWDRLQRSVTVFWDLCVEAIPVRALVKKARKDARVDSRVSGQNRAFVHLLSMEMRGMGWPAYEEVAYLARVMVEDIAQAEFEARRPLPKLRDAFWGFAAAYRTVYEKHQAVG